MFVEEKFAKRLSELRIKRGVSARDMSLTIGQSDGYINTIENGHSLPSMTSFFYICDYFGITPEEFFDFDSRDPGGLSALIEKMKRLDSDQLAIVESIVDNFK